MLLAYINYASANQFYAANNESLQGVFLVNTEKLSVFQFILKACYGLKSVVIDYHVIEVVNKLFQAVF